ncbi:hypothetical protein GX411_10165 [Candidatus Fermentibacteria bacterium]|nr:hypothetical protein [Candidatus Fermentibacteria bacterium]
MSEHREPLFSERVSGRNVTYFIEVRESSSGRVYLSLSEGRPAGGGAWEHQRITVFPDSAIPLRKAVSGAMKVLAAEAAARRQTDLEELHRSLHRAFERWTDEEDEKLRSAFAGGLPRQELEAVMGRSRRAVDMRLVKLGLEKPPEQRQTAR